MVYVEVNNIEASIEAEYWAVLSRYAHIGIQTFKLKCLVFE